MQYKKRDLTEYHIEFSQRALEQLLLMKKQEFRERQQQVRLSISGKGCDGFVYSLFFSPVKQDDVVIELCSSPELYLVLDPFSAYYFTSGTVDFEQQHEQEGFIILNHNQHLYSGKFFKDESTLPIN